MTEEERLEIFNEVFPIGQDVRYFVSDTEVQSDELQPGQPYSVYPKKIKRLLEKSAALTDAVIPLRSEGPFIRITWALLSHTGDLIILPTGITVPEEISLLQLWHKAIESRCRIPVSKIKWGKHWRAQKVVEEGKVSELQDNDGVEVILCEEKPRNDDRLEVKYTIGAESTVYTIWVKHDALNGDVKRSIQMAHPSRPIMCLAAEGAELTDEDSYSDWMHRTGGAIRQIQAKIVPLVKVILDYQGSQRQMSVRTNLSKTAFVAEVQKFIGTTDPLDVDPLGLDTWEIRDGTTYDVQVAKKVTLLLTDPDGKSLTVVIEGKKSLEDVCQSCHRQWGLKPWIRVSVKRQDDLPFYAEDGGKYFVVTQYDPALDPRRSLESMPTEREQQPESHL
jgi:hypothetical protein